MITDDALAFLFEHQPMPSDDLLTEALARRFEKVRGHFETVVDERCVPLLLNSFGRGSGFGTYQLVRFALARQPRAAVVAALPAAIRSERGSVRTWALEIAVDYATPDVVSVVKDVWPHLDEDERLWGATVLEAAFDRERDEAFVARAIAGEGDGPVAAILQDMADG